MRKVAWIVTFVTFVGCIAGAGASRTWAVEPGVDIAAPRVAISTADGVTLRFVPAALRVEQGDYARWNWNTGLHTTTSGAACVSDGLWTAPLSSAAVQFTRQFLEAPGARPYFCSPHCGLGMTGQVLITTLIDLSVSDVGGAVQLSWSGGGGTYRIFRSGSPLFGVGTTALTAAGGTTGTSFLDQTGGVPAVDTGLFYLVMNQF